MGLVHVAWVVCLSQVLGANLLLQLDATGFFGGSKVPESKDAKMMLMCITSNLSSSNNNNNTFYDARREHLAPKLRGPDSLRGAHPA